MLALQARATSSLCGALRQNEPVSIRTIAMPNWLSLDTTGVNGVSESHCASMVIKNRGKYFRREKKLSSVGVGICWGFSARSSSGGFCFAVQFHRSSVCVLYDKRVV